MVKNKVTPQPPVNDDGTPVDLKQYAFGYFDDGLIYKWPTGITPRHIHFEVQVLDNTIEACDVHFFTLEDDPTNKDVVHDALNQYRFLRPKGPNGFARVENSDIFIFRMGYFNYMKLNVESMIYMSSANQWYSIDLIINWENQWITMYVDQQPFSA